jgi:peptidoglycan-N-acetylglucosamine deacetylase
MKKWKAQSQFIVSGLFLVFLVYILNVPAIDLYVSSVKGQPVIVQVQPEWESKLNQVAIKYEKDPIDARIDQVWKAIPGYNGLKINKDKSLERMQQAGAWDESKLVFEEVKPKVNLADLKPAPIYRGNPQKPMISFMVNVAWGNEYLPEILKTFDKYKVKSTFFLDGSWTTKYPDEARKIKEAGHEIANHAYSHPDMKTLSMNGIRLEIDKTNEVIEKELGIKPNLFAPPSGSFDNRVVELAAQEGMSTILWTLDTVDWKKPAPSTIIQRLTPQLANGTLILMHPTESAAKALPALLDVARAKGLKVGTVSDVLSTNRIDSIE